MRIIREAILVAKGKVFESDKYIYSMDGESASLADVNPGDIVFYDPRTNLSVGVDVTAQDVPKLGIAEAIDADGRGFATAYRKVFGGYLDSAAIENVTTEPGRCGCNQIVDFYGKCTYSETPYSLTIETRGDRELDYNIWNRWSPISATVNMKDHACDTCESGVDEKSVFCALANQFNRHEKIKGSLGGRAFMKNALKQQAKDRGFVVYAIQDIEAVYKFDYTGNDCEDCLFINGVGGIKIGDTTVTFTNTTNDDGLTPAAQKDRIVKLILKAFRDQKVEGHAASLEQLTGSGAPCCGFRMIVNSCVDFDLLDSAGAVIAPVEGLEGQAAGKYNPLDTATSTRYASCMGCSDDTDTKFNAGLRVIAKQMEVTCDCNDPVDRKEWYHREVRFRMNPYTENTWKQYYIKQIQEVKLPDNLAIQWRKRMLDMDNGGTGYNYDNWTNDNQGLYGTPRKGTAFTESMKGLGCKEIVGSISIKHNLDYHTKSVNGTKNAARGVSHILIPNENTEAYTTIAATLNSWFGSIPGYNYTVIDLTQDTDQLEHVDFPVDADGDGVTDTGTGTGDATGTGGFDRGGDIIN